MTGTVLILGGTGKIGRHSAKAFEAAGWQVKQFDRHNDDMPSAAEGCDVIVNGLNPPNYHNWQETIPRITAQVIDAARQSGATVILPGNVYHFGGNGGTWSEHTPPKPVSRKGRIRLDMERAYADSGVQTIILRAGNFIDPDRRGCIMSEIYLRDITRGRITLPGPAGIRQAMCYLPDWGRASAALAEKRHELSRFEDIPFPGYTLSAQEIKCELERITGRSLTFKRFPWWMLTIAGPFWELARELSEMRYLWETDHALCGRRFSALLPDFEDTPLDEVMRSALKINPRIRRRRSLPTTRRQPQLQPR
jgi:nucleoside-diphosphate-sugar epimerase